MVARVTGIVQHYDWGDTTFIPQLFGVEPDGTPWAELWFGTHPVAPSHIGTQNGPLLSSIAGEMTMLVKVLACNQPLSLQTHPNRQQAARGFAREEAAGIALFDPKRTYKDASDKPEMIIALTDFEALVGFDNIDASVARLRDLGWNDEADVLDANGIDGYMLWAFDQRTTPSMQGAPGWLSRIADLYPTDRGLRIAPLLNHVMLHPGQVIALPAGNLHAYLHGAGLEVMASSDNVVRAGFTTKHVDVAELQRIVDTTPLSHPIVVPLIEDEWAHYTSPSPLFDVASAGWTNGHVFGPADKNRLIFGPVAQGVVPEMIFVAAGESLTVSGPPKIHCRSWVFTQN